MTWREGDPWDPGNPENKLRTRALQADLRDRLLEWDPIGVGQAWDTRDEYDCLISPLMHRLHSGADAPAVAAWLSEELDDHFGLGSGSDRGEADLAEDLVAWWRTATAQQP